MRHQCGSPSNRLFYPPKWIKCDVALRKRGGGGRKEGGEGGGGSGRNLADLSLNQDEPS